MTLLLEKIVQTKDTLRLSYENLDNQNFSHHDLSKSVLSKCSLRYVNFQDAILNSSWIIDTDLSYSNLNGIKASGSSFTGSKLYRSTLISASARNTDFRYSNLDYADCTGMDFEGSTLLSASIQNTILHDVNLTNVNFSGIDLSQAKLKNIIGIASPQQEQITASAILHIIDTGLGALSMYDWHMCDTVHCLAGWACPNERYPAKSACGKLPTLAKYFYSKNDEAYDALVRVANGEESYAQNNSWN